MNRKSYYRWVCENCRGPKAYKKSRFCQPCFYSPESRFWLNVKKTKSCWIWMASKHPFGYGLIRFRKHHDTAHRVSWILHNGDIPKGMQVLHKCDNPPCINPRHLYLGTQSDNMNDKKHKLRHSYGEGCKQSILTENSVRQIRKMYKRNSRTLGQVALAKKFGVDQTTISCVINRLTWAHVEPK